MTFYIRPRQDLSLATFSRILKSIYEKGVPHQTALVMDPESSKCEIRIEIVTKSRIVVEALINCICDDTGCIRDNFKIIEVSE